MSKAIKTHPIWESPKKEDNEEKFGFHSNTCVCCGKPTAEKLFIHASTHWVAVNTDNDDLSSIGMQSQGSFPIGAECAKKFPKEFIFKSK
jgi:hypothetical protein